MSVINNVLKDLEGRNSSFTPLEVAAVDSKPSAATAGKTRWSFWIALLAVVTVVALVFLQRYGYLERVLPSQTQTSTFEAVPPVAPVIPEVPAPTLAIAAPDPVTETLASPTEIIGLQLKEGESDLVLEFSLTERVISYLKERSENRFVYHISDVNSLIVAPILEDNPWLEQLALQPSDDGIDIRFTTKNNLMVETAQSVSGDEWIWSITFRKAIPRPAQAAEPQSAEPVNVQSVAVPAPVTQTPAPAEPAAEPQTATLVEQAPESAPLVSIRNTSESISGDSKLIQASRLIKSGQLTEAESVLNTLLNTDDDLRARRLLHGIYSRTGNRGAYKALLRESMQRYPLEAEFVSRYAGLLFRDQDYQAVIEFFTQRAPLEVGHHSVLAMSYQRQANYVDAAEQFKQALKLDGRDSKNWAGLAISLEQLGDSRNALKAYQQANTLGGLSSRLQQFVGERINALQVRS